VVALICRDADGQLGEQLLYRSGLDGCRCRSRVAVQLRRLRVPVAAEAMRIRLAGLHGPMLAVSSSETGCR
jgi:hypothetical protein